MPEADAHEAPERYYGFGPENKENEGCNENVESQGFVSEVGAAMQRGRGQETERQWEHGREADRCQAMSGERKIIREVSNELQSRTTAFTIADETAVDVRQYHCQDHAGRTQRLLSLTLAQQPCR